MFAVLGTDWINEAACGGRAMNRLDGKVALISGAARGIGGETARLMVEAGATVAIGDVLDERGRETARTLGDAALYAHLDVTNEEDWTAAVAAAVGRFGKLDILVNYAGLFLGKVIEGASLAEWERLYAVNLTGVFLGTKLCLPALREAAQQSPHGSAIVNLASTAGLVGSTQDPLYSKTKGGVTLFTKSAALEFARKGYRIRVNSIHPGTIAPPPQANHLHPVCPFSRVARVRVEYLAGTRFQICGPTR
jgi:NAD(P)-dependent dehydrogenase (short-subunit alcohol dehydrogenase family)